METEERGSVGSRLNSLLEEAGTLRLGPEQTARFETYLSLFLRWNARTNLSSIREPDAILSRHFVESIVCARALPAGIASLLDFGSGGGLPGIPIALCRSDIAVTMTESQGKKAAFLQEAVRVLDLSAKVFPGRAGALTQQYDCVVLRAVDRMSEAVAEAATLVAPEGWLALMSTRANLAQLFVAAGTEFTWSAEQELPGSTDRVLALGQRIASSPI
jgi:16S rRNA (guanine527-N7)-methyltransferase